MWVRGFEFFSFFSFFFSFQWWPPLKMMRKVVLVLASMGIVEAFTIVPLRSDGVRFAGSSLSVRRCSIPVLATPLSGLNSNETPKTETETPFIYL